MGSVTQPPVVTGQPLPACWQHQAFFAIDQPACQLAYPALQSYGTGAGVGAGVGAVVGGVGATVVGAGFAVGQPRPVFAQQYTFFAAFQPVCQLAKPALQSNAGLVVVLVGGGPGSSSQSRSPTRSRRPQPPPMQMHHL